MNVLVSVSCHSSIAPNLSSILYLTVQCIAYGNLEDRGCHIKDVHKWWDQRVDLKNVYTKTFADPKVGARRYFRGAENSKERRNFMATAVDTLSKFHIVLSMEWLAYGGPQGMPLKYYIDMTNQIPMNLN